MLNKRTITPPLRAKYIMQIELCSESTAYRIIKYLKLLYEKEKITIYEYANFRDYDVEEVIEKLKLKTDTYEKNIS